MGLRSLLFIVVLFAMVQGRALRNAGEMSNSSYAPVDSFAIDSADVVYSRAFALDNGTYKTLMVEMRDDSSAGFASDRGAVSIEFMQLLPVDRNNNKYFSVLRSKADTTNGSYPAGGAYMLFDSLDIVDMDTASMRYRDVVIDSAWNKPRGKMYGDSILVVDTTGNFGAVDYISFTPDFTPTGCFRVTGLKGSLAAGDGVHVLLYLARMEADLVRQK